MEEQEYDFRTEPTQIELAKLEKTLLQAERYYNHDISILQNGLLRARKANILHLLSIHLRLIFLAEFSNTIPLERALNKWKSRCVTNNSLRNHKLKLILQTNYILNLTRAFYILKERRSKKFFTEKHVEGPAYSHGIVAPLSSDDEDLEI